MPPLKLTRRTFSLTVAGAAASAALPKIGLAGEIATISVGDIAISMLSDGHIDVPPGFFTGADPAALDAAGNPVTLGATSWLVKDGARFMLVDTGSGQALAEMFPTVGQLDALLQAEGIAKSDITDIVLTHMHPDHIGALMGPDAGGFINATIHVSDVEWAFWANPDLPSAVPEADRPIVELIQAIAAPLADRVTTYSGAADLGSGITLLPLAGHTPGHCGVRIAGADGQAVFLVGDAIISQALQFDTPEVQYALDADPQQAIATRRALLDELAESGAVFSATHLAYPGTGRVTRSGSGFVFQPL